MSDIRNTSDQKEYWSQRYQEARTGWDIGAASTPLISYIDQLTDKNLKILIPGAGNAYEAAYLFDRGFSQSFVLDLALEPLQSLVERCPNFPKAQIIQGNFFQHQGCYDLIIEQTFFCSFPPTPKNRSLYAHKMNQLLSKQGKLVGLWFNTPLTGDLVKRPFGGSREEYLSYLNPYFETKTFESCHNSIAPRKEKELFGIFQKKT